MSIEKVREYFKETPFDGKIIETAESSATVALAAQALNIEPDQIAKTLSFLVDDKPVLILFSGMVKVDNAKYRHQFGVKAKMIPFEEVEKYIGHAPGGVCPFGVPENVKVYLDESLKKWDFVYPAAGSSNSAIKMDLASLEKYSKSLGWIDVSKNPEIQQNN